MTIGYKKKLFKLKKMSRGTKHKKNYMEGLNS